MVVNRKKIKDIIKSNVAVKAAGPNPDCADTFSKINRTISIPKTIVIAVKTFFILGFP
jgi:hypothetical protein